MYCKGVYDSANSKLTSKFNSAVVVLSPPDLFHFYSLYINNVESCSSVWVNCKCFACNETTCGDTTYD